MSAGAPPPPPPELPREPDYSVVERADAETVAHFRRLRAADELYTRAQDAGDEWVHDKRRRDELSDQLDQATVAANAPTTSEPVHDELSKSLDRSESAARKKPTRKRKR